MAGYRRSQTGYSYTSPHYYPSHSGPDYYPSHISGNSNYANFGLTYDPDSGFSAVDPFKPSVAYSIQNLWAPKTWNTDDLDATPPMRHRSSPYYSSSYGQSMPYTVSGPTPISVGPLGVPPVPYASGPVPVQVPTVTPQPQIVQEQPVFISPSRSPSPDRIPRERRHHHRRSRSRSRSQSPTAQRPPYGRHRRSLSRSSSDRMPYPTGKIRNYGRHGWSRLRSRSESPVPKTLPQLPSRSSSDDMHYPGGMRHHDLSPRRSRSRSPRQFPMAEYPPNVRHSRSPSRSSSNRMPHPSDSRRHGRSPRRSRSRSRRQSSTEPRPIPIRSRSLSRSWRSHYVASSSSSSPDRRPYRSFRSFSPLSLIHSSSMQDIPRYPGDRSPRRFPSPRKRVRLYSSRRRSSSPVAPTDGPKVILPIHSSSETDSVRPSGVYFYVPTGPIPISPASTDSRSLYFGEYPVRTYIFAFVFDTLPRQIYLHFLLRLPHLYFSRVSRIFEEADMSLSKIKQGILEAAAHNRDYPEFTIPYDPPTVQFGNLEKTWKSFIDSLLQEWQTLNIISVMLLSAILAIVNISDAANDPLTRFAALISMICALMSLVYGCAFIIRFGTMRKAYKAAEWAQESKNSQTYIFWNVWILLAMPATWLAWSLLSFIICMISFIWRAGTLQDGIYRRLSWDQARIPRIVASCVFAIGFVYFMLIIATLRRYGSMMDLKWEARIRAWMGLDPYPVSVSWPGYQFYQPGSLHSNIYPSNPYTPPSSYGPTYTPTPYPSTSYVPPTLVTIPSAWPNYPANYAQPVGGYRPVYQPVRPIVPMPSRLYPDIEDSMLHRQSTKRENGPEAKKVRMTKLVSLFNAEEERDSESPSPPDSDLSFCRLSKEVWAKMNEGIIKSWDPNKLESLIDVLDWWNALFNKFGTQIAVCQESADGLTNYAIYHFATNDRLSPTSCFEARPTFVRKLVILPLDELRMHVGPWNENVDGITLRLKEETASVRDYPI